MSKRKPVIATPFSKKCLFYGGDVQKLIMSNNDKGFPAWNGCKNILIFNPKVIRVYLAGYYQQIVIIVSDIVDLMMLLEISREDFPGRTFPKGLYRKEFPKALFILSSGVTFPKEVRMYLCHRRFSKIQSNLVIRNVLIRNKSLLSNHFQ